MGRKALKFKRDVGVNIHLLHEFEHETTLTTTVVNYVYDVTSSVARRTMMKKGTLLGDRGQAKGRGEAP